MECMQNQNKIKVIGLGPEGETFYKQFIKEADIVVGGKRLLNFFQFNDFQQIVFLEKNITSTLTNLKKKLDKNIVILASGDPLFFGIGKKVIDIFGKELIEFYPYLNSIQILASKAKIPYNDITFYSVHGRNFNKEYFLYLVKYNSKIAILTDKKNNINLIIKTLKSSNLKLDNISIVIGQMLGTVNEKIISCNINSHLDIIPSDLDSIIILNREPYKFYNSGLLESEFYYTKNLITKKEVRAVSISLLQLNMDSILWDIGGGSGSISIEAASLCFKGKVFIIEKNKNRIEQIKKNIAKFLCHNIEIIYGDAMNVVNVLPLPDRIFIGGFSGNIEDILDYIKTLKKEIIVVINIVIIEKLFSIVNWCKKNNVKFEVSQIQVSNLNEIGDEFNYFKSQNPVNILKLVF